MAIKILYVCECCHESAPEGCGRPEPDEVAVMPNGAWLCEGCFEEEFLGDYGVKELEDDELRPSFSDFPHPAEYVPRAA